jgi:hypothetical protein
MNERHIQATSRQVAHNQQASKNRSQYASVNHGTPPVAAMSRLNGARYNPQGQRATGTPPVRRQHINPGANANTGRANTTAHAGATQPSRAANRSQVQRRPTTIERNNAPVTRRATQPQYRQTQRMQSQRMQPRRQQLQRRQPANRPNRPGPGA